MRIPIIAGNWKLHKTVSESVTLAEALRDALAGVQDREIIVAPVFTALATVARTLRGSGIRTAAQNCYPETTGAFTGEVSPALLKDAGCGGVIVGHSERRTLFGETDDFINRKVRAVLDEELTAIFCIGETLQEREDGAMFEVLSRQLEQGLDGCSRQDFGRIVVAYEPVWAIGTGKTASTQQAQDAHAFIRSRLADICHPAVAEATRILYGGSVKPDNIDGLMAEADVDGALVGGASLKAEDFIPIVRFARG